MPALQLQAARQDLSLVGVVVRLEAPHVRGQVPPPDKCVRVDGALLVGDHEQPVPVFQHGQSFAAPALGEEEPREVALGAAGLERGRVVGANLQVVDAGAVDERTGHNRVEGHVFLVRLHIVQV